MRINHNIQALNAYRNLSQTMGSTSKSLEKLSSGLRINRAADDAAGLAISEKMRSQIRGLGMAERNALDAVSLIQTAEGALNETHAILQRMRELSVQAANGTLEDEDRGSIHLEIEQLREEIDRIAETTQFNQKVLLNGATSVSGSAIALSLVFQIGANSTENLTVELETMNSKSLEIETIDVSTASSASDAIAAVDNSIKIVSEQRAKLGAYQNRLEHTVTNLQTANENLTAAESRIRDLDMALEMTNFTRNNILNQAGQAMLAQANQLPQGILQLLQ
ncbi:flagellin N-terminal helical domain-containing protein [Lederbergia citri]|uniref:Flagellin n=1 Tax=Lederbergia citri TaxID=2833580 RepID=A0A942TCX5_9BACI|nr:flagellin [Lederbergia citri]MBS4195510.1 flagellin [Lederbergia citri]